MKISGIFIKSTYAEGSINYPSDSSVSELIFKILVRVDKVPDDTATPRALY